MRIVIPLTIAGHSFVLQDKAGGLLNLCIALQGVGLGDLARALGKGDGARVSSVPAGGGRGACYVIHCPGFKMVLSSPREADGFASALVSRAPQPVLSLMSELGTTLERLMSAPMPSAEVDPAPQLATNRRARMGTSPLRQTTLDRGSAPARKTPLKRKTPLARGRTLKP